MEYLKGYQLADRSVPNRLVAQAMEVNSASPGGAVNQSVLNRYKELAEGKWGIVFLEATSITHDHLARSKGLVLNRKTLDGFKRLVETFKKANDSSLFLFQLTHSGRQSGPFSSKVKAYEDEHSDIPVLSESDLDRIREQFIEAVALSKEAGADGVDVKACHGYLGCELLRPLNQREDKYGGSAKNRAWLIASVIKEAVRQYPGLIVGSRISTYEGIRGGCGTSGPDEIIEDLSDMQAIVDSFIKSGAHYLNVSSGIPGQTSQLTRPNIGGHFYRSSHYRYASQFKKWFPDTAIIGSVYTMDTSKCLEVANENLEKGYTDFVGFGRQNLADALFPEKIMTRPEEVNYCSLCGKCSKLLRTDKNVYCQEHQSKNPYV